MELNEILKVAIKGGASDIHLKSGLPPMFRVDGALVPLKNGERIMPEEIQQMAVSIMNPVQKTRFEEHREADLAYMRREPERRTDPTRVLEGEYFWEMDGSRNRLEVVFEPTGEQRWNVEFRFK